MKTRSFFIVIFFSFSQITLAADRLISINDYVGPTREAIKQIRAEWKPHLTTDQLKIEEKIAFSVPATWGANGLSRHDCTTGRNREIIITAGQSVILAMIANGALMNISGQITASCFNAYLYDLSEAIWHNTQLQTSAGRRRPAFEIGLFIKRYPDLCPIVGRSRITDKEYKYLYEELIKDSLRLLLSHELGHQIYDHGCQDITKQESRKNEICADKFAIDLILKQDPASLLGAFPLLTFWSMDRIVSADQEIGNTHPAGLRRLRSVIEAIEDNIKEHPEGGLASYVRDKREYAKFQRQLAEFRNITRSLE